MTILRPISASRSILLAFALATLASAHGGHDRIAEDKNVSDDPIDSTLWTHILLQTVVWGILFPVGMVLGLARSRWHVPLQLTAAALTVPGYFLGHAHKGRQFTHGAHAGFANWLMLLMFIQVGVGLYLKLHLERGFLGGIRKTLVIAHGIIGAALPIATWVQFLFGVIASQGFCFADHTGQCIAHFIMGSAFIGYGIVLTMMLLNGQAWLARRGRSQEFYDNCVIATWGCVNTFTEHRWGQEWAGNDLQHTSMGIIWWAAGLVGIWLSSDRAGRPRRNLIPGLVLILTGWAMSGHTQQFEISTKMHAVFGYTLMAAGLTRIIEISFILRDKHTLVGPEDGDVDAEINSWQWLPPFLLYASGFMFMGATEEQMQVLHDANIMHVSYILIIYSAAFLMFLYVLILVNLYSRLTANTTHSSTPTSSHTHTHTPSTHPMPRFQQRKAHTNGSAHPTSSRVQASSLADAEEFELEGLVSDYEDDEYDDETGRGKKSLRDQRTGLVSAAGGRGGL